MPSKVGGLDPTNLSTAGTNVEGQILPGSIPDINPEDLNYIGGSYDQNNQQHSQLVIATDDFVKEFDLAGAAPKKMRTVFRRISW